MQVPTTYAIKYRDAGTGPHHVLPGIANSFLQNTIRPVSTKVLEIPVAKLWYTTFITFLCKF